LTSHHTTLFKLKETKIKELMVNKKPYSG